MRHCANATSKLSQQSTCKDIAPMKVYWVVLKVAIPGEGNSNPFTRAYECPKLQ